MIKNLKESGFRHSLFLYKKREAGHHSDFSFQPHTKIQRKDFDYEFRNSRTNAIDLFYHGFRKNAPKICRT